MAKSGKHDSGSTSGSDKSGSTGKHDASNPTGRAGKGRTDAGRLTGGAREKREQDKDRRAR